MSKPVETTEPVTPEVEPTTEPVTDPPAVEPEPGEPVVEPEPAEEEGAKDAAYLTKELERTRRESANYRTQAREAREALARAKSPEEFEDVVKDFTEKLAATETALTKERVARKHSLPDALASRLVGSTEAELIADAKELAKLVNAGADPDSLSGGLDPSEDDGFDPVAEAKKARLSRR
jgi:hypothetical protein